VNVTQEKDSTLVKAINVTRPFVDVDLAFPNRVNVTAEDQLKDAKLDSDALASIVVRYPFTDALTSEIGITNAQRGAIGSSEFSLVAGVNVSFSGFQDTTVLRDRDWPLLRLYRPPWRWTSYCLP
jgi:hypothetical protein